MAAGKEIEKLKSAAKSREKEAVDLIVPSITVSPPSHSLNITMNYAICQFVHNIFNRITRKKVALFW